MSNTTAHRYTRFGLEIVEISATEWRVSDAQASEHDALALLGFVQQVRNTYEVTEIGRPGMRLRFSTFDEALQHLQAHPR
ncbi:hypothetical protein ACFVWR_10170 [Leifsonia sp. NPDC058292]|uniref:hypothetical protein n=1 Tax=Leifsonia sp. NPDC058292 TaxID=3346428 RepID=UPI0036DDE3BD